MHLDHKRRWIFGPVVDNVPAAADYAVQWECPLVVDGHALTHCTLNAHQLAAARQDSRLTVLSSIHSGESIPNRVADHHARHGLERGDTLPHALLKLAAHHHAFEPED